MKKLQSLLLALCITLLASAQINQVNIVNFTVKNTLPANIDNWLNTPGALLLTAQKVPGARLLEPRLVIQVKSGGAVICGNNPGTARPVDPFDVRTFNTADLTGILTNCRELKEGTYSICVQFFNVDKVAISREVCKEFRVEGAAVDYAPPTLITPDNGKKFTVTELQRPVIFRWTPLVPKPKEPVTYKLRVWQLMQGQNGAQAMKANQPIVAKDVDNNTQVTITNLLTGPCKPPYLCDFIWNVQAVNRSGKPIGRNNGTSEPYSFKVQNNIDIEIDSIYVSCCENGKQNIYIKVDNNLAGNVRILAIKYKINGTGPNITLTPLTPPLPVIIPGNGSQVFTSSINCIDTASNLKFLVDAEDVADPDNTETEVGSDTLNCYCNACDSVKIDVVQKDSIKLDANGNLVLNNTINISPKPVKSISADLVYFEYKPESDDCMICNKDSKTFGNFISATAGNQTLPLPYNHVAQWTSTNPNGQMVNGIPLQFNISMPPTVKCCAAQVRWCIRYVVTFADCTVCNKLVCYTYNKKCDCQ
jgi:hypothetical protein